MSRPAAYTDGSVSPMYVTRSHGLDSNWKTQAKCAGLSNDPMSPWYDAWFVEPSKRRKLHSGAVVHTDELIAVALDICMHCPVQWDCAGYAVDGMEPQGTWGARYDDIKWLTDTKQKGAIEVARQLGEPVQVMVKRLRAAY